MALGAGVHLAGKNATDPEMIAKLKELVERVEAWPKEAQEAAIESLQALEEEFFGITELSPADIEALDKSADDVRNNRFAGGDEVRDVFARRRHR